MRQRVRRTWLIPIALLLFCVTAVRSAAAQAGTGVLTGTLKAGSFSAAEGSSVKGEIWLERAEPARVIEAGRDDGEHRR